MWSGSVFPLNHRNSRSHLYICLWQIIILDRYKYENTHGPRLPLPWRRWHSKVAVAVVINQSHWIHPTLTQREWKSSADLKRETESLNIVYGKKEENSCSLQSWDLQITDLRVENQKTRPVIHRVQLESKMLYVILLNSFWENSEQCTCNLGYTKSQIWWNYEWWLVSPIASTRVCDLMI